MGPHPGRRPILTLKGAIKATVASSSPSLLGKAANGSQTAAGVVRVGGEPGVHQAGPVATGAHLSASASARKLARIQALARLAVEYPAVFGTDIKPLAVGVGRLAWPEAKAGGIKRRAFHDALKWRTSSIAYLEALAAPGAMRFDPHRQRDRIGESQASRAGDCDADLNWTPDRRPPAKENSAC